MNIFKEISPESIRKNTFQMIGKEWMLIAAGDQNKANAMTASWGGFGVMYGKNVVYAVVRPQRYTKEFIDREDEFSLNFFEKEYKKTLKYMGGISGRIEDKIEKSGLTLEYSGSTPYFNEARQILICKKLFAQPLEGEHIIDSKLDRTWYPNKDYHTLYIAEITKALQVTRESTF